MVNQERLFSLVQVALLLHGERGLSSARRCTNALFGASLEDLRTMSAAEVAATFPGAGVVELSLSDAVNNENKRESVNRRLALTDVVIASRHCHKMILAKRPNFQPHVVEKIASSNAAKLISEGAVKINFVKMTDGDFRDFEDYMLRPQDGEDKSAWTLMTIAKKHQYIIKWNESSRDTDDVENRSL